MGISDTIIFENPIVCKCGAKKESIQIKEFDSMLETYHVGDMIPSSPMFALFEEWDYCNNCDSVMEFYVACSYGIYLGVFESYKEAKEEIDSFGMEKLLKFYAQRVPQNRGIFHTSDRRFMERVVDFYDSPQPKKEGRFTSLFSALHDFKEETPLEAIKNYLKQDELIVAVKRCFNDVLTLKIDYKIVDKKTAYIYNEKIENSLKREYLFRLNKIDDRTDSNPSKDNILVSFKEINEKVILDKVQQWLDDKGIELKVCLNS